tara:strand:+ start:334 stop:528 length:195 start_codon:yes stop_codon:yes gene_type:complete
MNAEYPPKYDDATECVSCGDDPMNAPQPNPEEPMKHCCCSWQCYAIKLKLANTDLQTRVRKMRR